jgi:hypothetical protein
MLEGTFAPFRILEIKTEKNHVYVFERI